MALRRIKREIKDIKASPPQHCSLGPVGDDLFKWTATVIGPKDTPYENGVFLLDITIPKDYPFNHPKITFMTKIYHCNARQNSCIKFDGNCGLHNFENWSPALTINKVLLRIIGIFSEPDCNDPANIEAAKVYKRNRNEYNKIATEW
eukprot:355355_1